MNLPDNFSFSQHNLQDFADCKYRFYLRHIRNLEWPAVESEPLKLQEEKMELGFQFHKLVQQYFSGISPQILTETIEIPELSTWWNKFLELNIDEIAGVKHSEKLLSTTMVGHRLVAKYDLLVLHGSGKITIFDWKTSSNQPARINLIKRIQSKVYPAVIMSQKNTASPFRLDNPADLEMIYWYPAFPETPVKFQYSQSQYDDDDHLIEGMIEQILAMPDEDFHKTPDERKCSFCRYRSLCERGIIAGVNSDEESEFSSDDAFDINFDAL